ncbi:type II toxin-antitoxin system HicB family antitoxin [Streptomyces sp. NPDC057611]|uniref:type II toxin-antitoxin system HicB family antitoxin n=1 Tax=Streptomyces sp. NPDC057611 TaxID=3346182 RepID=UPI0036983C3A
MPDPQRAVGDRMEETITNAERNHLAAQKIYHASAERDGRWWIVKLLDLPKGYAGATQGRTWSEAERMAKDAVAMLLEVDVSSISVELHIADKTADSAVAKYKAAREAAERARVIRDEELTRAARELTAHGITVRDAGAILEVPYQTVSKVAPKDKDRG